MGFKLDSFYLFSFFILYIFKWNFWRLLLFYSSFHLIFTFVSSNKKPIGCIGSICRFLYRYWLCVYSVYTCIFLFCNFYSHFINLSIMFDQWNSILRWEFMQRKTWHLVAFSVELEMEIFLVLKNYSDKLLDLRIHHLGSDPCTIVSWPFKTWSKKKKKSTKKWHCLVPVPAVLWGT